MVNEKDIRLTVKTRCGLCFAERTFRTTQGQLQDCYPCASHESRSGQGQGQGCPGVAWVVDRRVGAWVRGELRVV